MTVKRQPSDDHKVPLPAPAVPISVTAFVDWKSQIHNAGARGVAPADERAQRTLEQTVRSVGAGMAQATEHERAQRTLERTVRAVRSALMSEEKSRFRVSFRLYHGWHKGWQPTDGLKAVLQAVDATDFTALSYAASTSRPPFSMAIHCSRRCPSGSTTTSARAC